MYVAVGALGFWRGDEEDRVVHYHTINGMAMFPSWVDDIFEAEAKSLSLAICMCVRALVFLACIGLEGAL